MGSDGKPCDPKQTATAVSYCKISKHLRVSEQEGVEMNERHS